MKHCLPLAVLAWLFFSGCERTGDCLQPAGELKRVTIPIGSFQSVSVYNNVELQIIPSADQRVEAEYGANLLDQLHFELQADTLLIKNSAKCHWVHSYEKPKVYLYTSSLSYLKQFSSGTISNVDTLRGNRLTVVAEEAPQVYGDIKLTVNLNELIIFSNSTTNFYLKGKVSLFSPNCYWNNGIVYADQLIAKSIWLDNSCYNDLYINSDGQIAGHILNSGNVYYRGNPGLISVEERWTGRLIKL